MRFTDVRYDSSLDIQGDPDVYPPSEDSVMLIESLEISSDEKILEIGCGSGVVSIHCARYGADVVCGDINPAAVELTRANAERNGAVLEVTETDLFSGIDGRFDTIVFNLPYLPVQDDGVLAKAWSGGDDGMGPLPRLIEEAPDHLEHGGRVVVVVSSLMDQPKLDALLAHCETKVLAELPLFFERLRVLEIRFSR